MEILRIQDEEKKKKKLLCMYNTCTVVLVLLYGSNLGFCISYFVQATCILCMAGQGVRLLTG